MYNVGQLKAMDPSCTTLCLNNFEKVTRSTLLHLTLHNYDLVTPKCDVIIMRSASLVSKCEPYETFLLTLLSRQSTTQRERSPKTRTNNITEWTELTLYIQLYSP